MKELQNKVAVVTGAASGIGRALAGRFADEKMAVVLADVDEAALGRAEDELRTAGTETLAVATDVASDESVAELARRTVARFGTAHVVCNNAGVAAFGACWEIDPSVWEWVLGVDLGGVINGIRHFVPLLLEQGEGHVVNTASMAGLLVGPYAAPYTVAKHGVVGLSETLHHELGLRSSPVKVSVLCPGYIKTNLMDDERWKSRLGDTSYIPEDVGSTFVRQMFTDGIESGASPDELAELVVGAIREERFWVLNDRDLGELVLRRYAAAVEGAPPALGPS